MLFVASVVTRLFLTTEVTEDTESRAQVEAEARQYEEDLRSEVRISTLGP